MAKIIVRNKQDLENLQLRLRSLKRLYPRLQQLATESASEKLLDEIHSKMKKANFSDKIIDATFVGRTQNFGSILRQHFISNYVADNGFDVSKGREEGTTHTKKIRPKKVGGVLRWIGAGGKPIFRKWSKPKGIERLLIIEKTLKENKEQFKTDISNNLTESFKKVLGV